jgi:hypothetical protein
VQPATGVIRRTLSAGDMPAGVTGQPMAEEHSTTTACLHRVMPGARRWLRRPLWGRSLTDGSTGRLIPYLDGRKLQRVTYLPPGYQFSAYLPFPSAPVFTAWEREYISAGQATAPVDIEQVPGNAAVPPSWPVTSRVPVGRQLATVGTQNDHIRPAASTSRPGSLQNLGGSVSDHQEPFASLAAGQTRLQSHRSGRPGRMFIHRRSYRERTH